MEYKETIGSVEKALKLLEIICKEKEFTAKLIAEKMNCNIRTARRYIEKIRYLFEDLIEIKPGYKYCWKGLPDIDEKLLNSSNLQLLFALIELGKKIDNDKDFWKTLKSYFSKNIDNNGINILFGKVLNYEKIKNNKVKLEDAISRGKCIKFKYLRYNQYYEIEPLRVLLWEGFWYIVGVHIKDNKFKTFALDLIDEIEIIEDSAFEKTKKSKKLEKQLQKADTILHISNKKPDEIKIIVFSEVSKYFERRDILHEQKILKKYENGELLISFKVMGEGDLRMQLYSWIPFFKIIEPPKYKNIFLKILKKGIKQHDK